MSGKRSQGTGILGKAAIAAAAPAVALGAFTATMKAIDELYSRKVWATDEELASTMPGDDLIADPNGEDVKVVFQARDLDAPLEEVWKHIYQMDIVKAGYYSWVNFERLFGMNVNNYYTVEEMWQGPDEKRPGDFWPWGLSAYGAEVVDIVPNKYVVWAADSRNPSRIPGAYAIRIPGMDYCIYDWCIALKPLDDGRRCRILSKYILAWGPHTPVNDAFMDLVVAKGGAMMNRRMFVGLEKAARMERPMSAPLRAVGKVLARSYWSPAELQGRVTFPEIRWSRDFPRWEDVRAPITDDPNWPPAPGEDYVPPIAENNAKCGWTPGKAAENEAKARAKQAELMERLGIG